jgi:hypothetical protein
MERLAPYLLIAMASIVSHGLLLTNDGTIWDSWYVLNFLETRNWPTLREFFGSVGVPLFNWLYPPFAWLPDPVAGFMWATFLCLLGSAILTYRLGLSLGRLTRSESLVLALLAQAMPVFSAAQDFIMFFFIFTHTLFLAAAVLAARMLLMHGRRQVVLRGLAVLAFYVSFTNSALLVFYGAFYLLLFLRYRQSEELPFPAALRRFVSSYPEFLLLPPATWAARPIVTPQYGWYEHYNSPIENLSNLWPNLKSFFSNALPHHFWQSIAWPVEHPLATTVMVVAILAYRMIPAAWSVKRSALSTMHLAWFGGVSLLLAVFPFAAAGKWFSPVPLGENSRHAIFAGLPLAILSLAILRGLFLSRATQSRWLPPIVGCLAFVLAAQVAPVYLAERAEWVYSRAVLHHAVRNSEVRNSSIILLQGYSIVKQDAYGLFGFASAFGELTRLVTARGPENGRFFTPSEIEKILLYTTLLPGNYRRIDPDGQQILLIAERVERAAGDWMVVSQYMKLRYFGTQSDLEGYLASLVALKTFVLRPASSRIRDVGRPEPATLAAGVAGMDFTNGSGMVMVRMQAGGWASKFETTQAQFQRVMGINPSLFADPSRPVDSVSWHEAVAFCSKVTALEASAARLPTGLVYRLPTSAEFEQIATGSTLKNAVTSSEEVRWQSEPAGSMPPSALGLHDVFGNVWEWSLDWGDRARRLKVSNGGSWVDRAADLSYPAGSRAMADPFMNRVSGPIRKDYPDQGFWNRGFRCLLAPQVKEPVR